MMTHLLEYFRLVKGRLQVINFFNVGFMREGAKDIKLIKEQQNGTVLVQVVESYIHLLSSEEMVWVFQLEGNFVLWYFNI